MSVPSVQPPPAAETTAASAGLHSADRGDAFDDYSPTHPELARRRSGGGPTNPREAALGTEELRLAMAFTGGISLAVWMGGVAREVDLLIQASDRRRTVDGKWHDPATPDPDPVRRLYRRLLDLVDVQVSVDVLSGTSAGGINAALLGVANARRGDLSSLRHTWLTMGSLSHLLRDPHEPNPPSLLKGDEQLLAGLREALDQVRGVPDQPAHRARRTDVFITTTYLSAETSRYADDFGTQIVDSDHHGLFHFDQDALVRKETIPALALAARSSASFPGAFEPSFIPFREDGADADHPAMAQYSNASRPHWAADGGLLVNRPLAPLLQTIFDRGADRQVRRALLYVVPTSASPKLPYAAQQGSPLSLATALVSDLEATLNQSIAADLAAIKEHNDRTSSAADTRLRLADLGRRLPIGDRLARQPAWDDYRTRQGNWLVAPLVAELTRQLGIPGRWPAWDKTDAASRSRTVRAMCRQAATVQWPARLPTVSDSSTAAAEAGQLGQSAFDSAKAVVLRLLRLGYLVSTTVDDRGTLSQVGTQIHQLHQSTRQTDLRRFVGESLKTSWDQRASVTEAATAVAKAFGRAQGDPAALRIAWVELTTIAEAMMPVLEGLLSRVEVGQSADPASTLSRRTSAAIELETYLDYLRRGDVVLQLLDLHIVARSVLPVLAEVEQPVELVQVSADTRTALAPGRSTAARKLTGLQFHHFGAFYKASWRANDWMWGRLDGCGWLVHILMDPRRILNVMEDDSVPPGARRETFVRSLMAAVDAPEGTTLPAEADATLDYLDDETIAIPASLPALSLWVAEQLQRYIAADELRCVATQMRLDQAASGPGRTWLADFDEKVKLPDEAARRDAIAALLWSCPVPDETLDGQRGSPLFLRTATRTFAVATAAGTSLRKPPASLRPTFATLRSITHTAYLATDRTQAQRRGTTLLALGLLGVGVLAMLTNIVVVGLTGAIMFGAGSLLLALCIGRNVKAVAQVVLGLAVVLLAAAPWLPVLDDHLFSWLEQTFLPWISDERWIWPILVLVLLLPPATTLGALIGEIQARKSRSPGLEPDPFDPYPAALPQPEGSVDRAT